MSLETQLIAELMLESAAFDSFIEIASDVDELVFLDAKNRSIYAAIKELRLSGESCDIVNVAGKLESQKKT